MPSNTRKNKTVRYRQNKQPQLWRRVPINRSIVLALFVLASTVGLYYGAGFGHAAQAELRSGVGGNLSADTPGSQCLDDKGDGGPGTQLDIWPCNGSAAQKFSYDGTLIHIGTGCAVEQGASASSGVRVTRAVVIGSCTNPAPWGGAWTKSGGQFHNNHATGSGSPYCMDVSGGASQGPVIVYPCKPTSSNGNERWYPDTYGGTSGGGGGSGGTVGDNIFAEAYKYVGKENEAYKLSNGEGCNCGGTIIDGGNINTFQHLQQGVVGYPDGWCAFFVSWVYYKTGHQFNGGSAYNPIGGTNAIRDWFAARGKFYYNTAYNRANHAPQKGDFIDYRGGSHAGIFDSQSGGAMFSIDGNFGDGVHWDQTNNWATSGTVTGWGSL